MNPDDFRVNRLGGCLYDNPMQGISFTTDRDAVLYHGMLEEIKLLLDGGQVPPAFDMAGPREKIFLIPAPSPAALSPAAAYVRVSMM